MAMQGLGGLALTEKPKIKPVNTGLSSMAMPKPVNTMKSPTSTIAAPSSMSAPDSSNMNSSLLDAPKNNQPVETDLNKALNTSYSGLLAGKNPVQDQNMRMTLNTLGGQKKAATGEAAQKAIRMGFAPGSPGYEQIMDQANNSVVSSGSNLLANLSQQGLNQQTANLTGAQMFQSKMDSLGNESRALDQGDVRLGNEVALAGNTIKKTDADILNDAGQLGVTKDLAGNTIRKTDADIISGQRNDNLNSLLGFNTIKKTDADIANNAGQLDVTRDLAGNTIRKTDADISIDQGNLGVTRDLVGNTIKKTDADILNNQGQLDLNKLLGNNTIRKTEADIASEADQMGVTKDLADSTINRTNAEIADLKTRTASGKTKEEIANLDYIINHPEAYSAAQIDQAKKARSSYTGGAGYGGAADPTDQEAAVNYLADSLAQYPEYRGMSRDQLLEMARKQFGALDTNNMNSLLGAGLGNTPGSTGKKDPETGVVLTGNPIIDQPKIEAIKKSKAEDEAARASSPYPYGMTEEEFRAYSEEQQRAYDESHRY